MGEIIEMDNKGRVTIPANIRRMVGKTTFKIELLGKDTIVLRTIEDKHELVRKISNIKLTGDKGRASADAAIFKDFYGGVKH